MNIRTLCLGVLTRGEASGYEIKKEIEDGMYGHFIEASFGSIYPALTQMSAEGLLTVRAQEQSGKPDKKIYAITEAGRAALTKGLSVLPARDKFKSEFLFTMLLQDFVSPDNVALAMAKQRADVLEDLRRIDECCTPEEKANMPEGARFVMGYGHCVLSAALEYLDRALKPKMKAAE